MKHADTVVIGSGSGGLTAALALARAGAKVIVVEQHYLPGGWTHSFSLNGYLFSPGVHYIGGLGPGGPVRRLYEGLELSGDLEFCELNPDGFDHLLIGEERFDVPKGFDRLLARLTERFPHEAEGIARYFGVLRGLNDELLRMDTMLEFPKVLLVPFRAPHLLRWGFRTQEALLDATIRDPMLRAILSAQGGDHGLPPSRVSLPLHASVAAHYFDGGYYPRGGAKRIPLAMIRALRRRGGEIRMRARVRRILVERGRAAGVELEGGEILRAANVISNADPAITYGELLPPERTARERRKIQRMEYSVSLLSVFCAVDMDLRAMGYDSGNYWWYRTRDVGRIYERAEYQLPPGAVDGLFLTITTLKDPGHPTQGRHHTIEMFTFVPHDPFTRWEETRTGERGADYEKRKESLGDQLIAAAENIIPGISRALVFRSVATPLTNDFYCATHRGAAYGTAKTPWQLGPLSFSIGTRIPGLYLCGASTLSHGVAGAAMSGLLAAQRITGAARVEDLLGPADGSLRVYPADRPEEWLPARMQASAAADATGVDELDEVA
ncbi:phytoene dehydrogenase [Sorangium cellulosum]|uniref:Phytoene dehydrogenase n=1 Tax=Sorangium cellulosum TaxID=56 RepID=A0A4P2PUG4_SORCE|nr:NAD(P)/FAD-dependent oxidoreductase [Sorangium cellulosum]AUX20238.1 phytoene dehydrogenase [Sorangium cellulosum]